MLEEPRDAGEHPIVHRTVPQQRVVPHKTSGALELGTLTGKINELFVRQKVVVLWEKEQGKTHPCGEERTGSAKPEPYSFPTAGMCLSMLLFPPKERNNLTFLGCHSPPFLFVL